MSAPAATVIVEIGFTNPASTPDGQMHWVDVSADVRAVTINRGRQVELDEFDAGRATVVLSNLAAAYDPNNTAGPHYGNILPMRRIRISVSTDSIVPELFEGYIRGYQQGYVGTHEATTTLDCVDAFLVLANNQLPTGYLDAQVRANGARFNYRLGEVAGAITATDSISGKVLYQAGPGTFGNDGLAAYDPDTAYAQPVGPTQNTYLLNNAADLAILGAPGNQSMQFYPSPTSQAVTTPDTAAFTGLTALDVRVRLSRPDWTNGTGTYEDLIGKGGFSGATGDTFWFALYQNFLAFEMSAVNGTTTSGLVFSSGTINVAANATAWVGATAVITGTSCAIKFWLSDTGPADITTWTQVGTTQTVTVPSGAVFEDSVILPSVGARGTLAGVISHAGPLVGNVYQAVIRSSVNGTIIASPDFTDVAQWAVGDSSGTTGTDSTGKVWTAVGNEIITGTAVPFSIAASIKWDTGQAVGAKTNWIIAGQGDGRSGWYLNINGSGLAGLGVLSGGLLVTSVAGGSSLADGLVHRLVGTYDGSGTPRIYVDGALVATGTAQPVGFTGNGFAIGLANQLAGFGFWSWPGTIDEVSVYPSALTAAQVTVDYAYATTPAAGDTTGARMTRVLDAVNWPTGKRSIDNGTVTLQGGALNQVTLPYLQSVAASDQGLGIVFMSRDGKVVFQDAVHAFDHATPVITLAATNFMDVTTEYDDTLIRNVVTVTRDGGTPQTATDTASVSNYLTHSFNLEGLLVADDTIALNTARILLTAYANPAPRVTAVTVNRSAAGFATAAEYDALLTADIGDALRLQYTPKAGVALNALYTIEGIEHAIQDGTKDWTITYRLAPSITTLISAPITWVYLNNHYATWTAIAPRTWNNLAL